MTETLGFSPVVSEPPLHESKPPAKVQPLVADIQNFAQDVFDTVREPLIVLDAGLRVRTANATFYQTFHVSPEETENRLIYELGNGPLPGFRFSRVTRTC